MLSAGQTKGNTCTLSYGQSDNCKTQAQVITTYSCGGCKVFNPSISLY